MFVAFDSEFEDENIIYPRAHVPESEYTGNRWAYEVGILGVFALSVLTFPRWNSTRSTE